MDANPTIAWLGERCRSAAVDEKWLLVEHLRVGQQWKDRLTRSGFWHINLHAKTMRLIVEELAAPWLAESGWLRIGRNGLQMLIDSVVQPALRTQQLAYFNVHHSASHALSRLLVRTYSDWRLADLATDDLRAEDMEVPSKAADLAFLFQAIRQKLADTQQVDYADCIEGVMGAINAKQLSLPTGLQILLPEEFPLAKLERDLLDTLCNHGATMVKWGVPAEQLHAASSSRTPVTLASENEGEECLLRELGPAPSGLENGLRKFRAVGQINEVRGVFQQCLASAAGSKPFDDLEVLVTDYEGYAPLVLEGLWQWLSSVSPQTATEDDGQLGIDALPITFAEGIACIYSRPGRLLRSWIRWLESDHLQSKAVQIVREGLLRRPEDAAKVGYARLASTLRRVSIGFGLERYLPQIEAELAKAQRQAASAAQREGEAVGDYGASALKALLDTIGPMIALVPGAEQSPIDLLTAARRLIADHSRADSVIDRYARAKLLEDIDGMLMVSQQQSDALTNMRAWLEDLPIRSRLLASTPQPGCLHVAPIEQGGASGRSHVYVLGMDDRRFPRRRPIDPILLDAERARLSIELPTSEQIAQHDAAAVDRLLVRLNGIAAAQITFSYSVRDLVDDSEGFPSPILNALPIEPLSGQTLPGPQADDNSNSTEPAFSFIASAPHQTLGHVDSFLRSLLVEANANTRAQRCESMFPRMACQREAQSQQAEADFGPYDGWVPVAGTELLAGATSHPMSPSRLEVLGTCPRKYFFARALDIYPPDECQVDPDRWLTALELGNLLHNLFEQFLRELQVAGEMPDPALHSARLIERLHAMIDEQALRVPVRNVEAFRRQRDELVDYCEIFLQKEHEYAELRQAKTWIMEASLGSLKHSESHAATEIDTDKPIVVPLRSGRQLHLCGRIDRIDQLTAASEPEYLIWDYKTGSERSFEQADPIQQGRKLQPLLYVRMLATRLAQLGKNPRSVRGFGYFFPSPRAEGLRYEWTTAELAAGDEVLESMLDLLAAGTFIATNEKDDCTYCDYQRVCGSAEDLVTISNLKTNHPENHQLNAWRSLRAEPGKR